MRCVGECRARDCNPPDAYEGRDYLSVKLDDPSFTQPIYANPFDAEEGAGYSLIWSRSRKASVE